MCYPTNVQGSTTASAPDQVQSDANSITIRFSGHYDVTDCGGGSNTVMLAVDDPEQVKRGGCGVKSIKVTVKSQVKTDAGGWNDIKTTSHTDTGGVLHGDETHTFQRSKGANKVYRTRAQANVTYCDGTHENFPNGGGWDTSAERTYG